LANFNSRNYHLFRWISAPIVCVFYRSHYTTKWKDWKRMALLWSIILCLGFFIIIFSGGEKVSRTCHTWYSIYLQEIKTKQERKKRARDQALICYNMKCEMRVHASLAETDWTGGISLNILELDLDLKCVLSMRRVE
jgi:hypothetical protein